MKIAITPTNTFTEIDGQRVRVWNGKTASGVPCKVFVARIAVETGREAEFGRALTETGSPTDTGPVVLPLRMVL